MRFSVRIQEASFSVEEERQSMGLTEGEAGAWVQFEGCVRAEPTASIPLAALHLSHYPQVTEQAIFQRIQVAVERWSLLGVRIVHRVGRLAIGEPIVLVCVASAHRAAAFSATAYLMDYLKVEAPFWKKEEWADGSFSWVEPKASDTQAAEQWSHQA